MNESIFLILFFSLIISVLIYVFCISRFKSALKKHDPDGLKKLGFDTRSQLSPESNKQTRKKQIAFFFKKHYKQYPDPFVVKLARYAYISIIFYFINFGLFIVTFFCLSNT